TDPGAVVSRKIDRPFVDHVELYVHRDVEEHRAPSTLEGATGGGGDVGGEAVELPGGVRPGGDRVEQTGMVHLLETAHQLLAGEVAASQEEKRRARIEGVRHAGDGVGHAWPSGDRGDSHAPGETSICFGGMDGRLFVTYVDYPDSLLDTSVQDRDDVAPGEREECVHAFGFESPGDDLSTVDLGHAQDGSRADRSEERRVGKECG